MSTDLEKLQQENTILQAKIHWLTNVTQKMMVMIKNAAVVLDEYEKQINLIRVELSNTRRVYSNLHRTLTEVFDERKPQKPGLHETRSETADERRGGADSEHSSDSPEPE